MTDKPETIVAHVPGPLPRRRWRIVCLLIGHRWDKRGDLLAHCDRCGEWGIRQGG